MIEDQEGERKKLNKKEPQINRGFELMLRQHNRREKPSEPKTFLIRFGKMLSLFKREIHFQFEIFFDIKKK
jgi:transcription initiation factor TFIIIB Brf1 subunit/transcription initiation factor TFIIB